MESLVVTVAVLEEGSLAVEDHLIVRVEDYSRPNLIYDLGAYVTLDVAHLISLLSGPLIKTVSLTRSPSFRLLFGMASLIALILIYRQDLLWFPSALALR